MRLYNDDCTCEEYLYEQEAKELNSTFNGAINFKEQLKFVGIENIGFLDWSWENFQDFIYNLKDKLNWGHQMINPLWYSNRELAEDRVVNVEFLLNKIEWILKTALELKKGLGRDYNFNYDQYDWTIGQESFDYDRFWEEEECRI